MKQSKQIQRVLVLLADGARADLLFELLYDGKLPNIQRYLADQGTALTAVTSFPSTTGPAYLPYLTGANPGTCNIPGIRWFDKKEYVNAGRFSFKRYRSYVGLESFLIGRDLSGNISTVFEIVPDSYSIFNPIARGSGFRNKTRYSRIWYWYYAHLTDRWRLADAAALKKTLKLLDTGAKFIFTVLPGIDEYSHLTHPHHEKVLERYIWLDKAVGQIAQSLIDKRQWETTTLWLVSDHGLSKTDHHFCVNNFLEQNGLPPFFYPLIFDQKGKRAANMVSGNGMTHIYLKHQKGWSVPTLWPEINKLHSSLLDKLLEQEAVDIITCRDEDDWLKVISRRGKARIKLAGQEILYKTENRDPFGYAKLPEIMTAEEVLAETMDSDYPDAPFQLTQLAKSSRTGDVILSATCGFDLRLKYEHPEHKASHGSLHKSHMLVPILCNKPYQKRPARTVDVFPTILKSLNIPLPDNIDGLPLKYYSTDH
jgi:predicted AlkP superfamily phosphohydrolase/phosphomutase